MKVNTYDYLDGMEELLCNLNTSGYELHAMSNYPMWYRCIEDKLELSQYLQWTFISCEGPMKGLRKPTPTAYDVVISHLEVEPAQIVFVDDRKVNVEAAAAAGMQAVLFQGADDLVQQLAARGVAL